MFTAITLSRNFWANILVLLIVIGILVFWILPRLMGEEGILAGLIDRWFV